jgi:cytochrome c-type biogenesis protein CcmE
LIVTGLAIMASAAGLILNAFRSNLVFFYTPSQIAVGEAPVGRGFRLGGLVEQGSVRRTQAVKVAFVVTDTAHRVTVSYSGILPDLFREGKGVVVEGSLAHDGVFQATGVLAKHDENYMPPEAAEALAAAHARRGIEQEGAQ